MYAQTAHAISEIQYLGTNNQPIAVGDLVKLDLNRYIFDLQRHSFKYCANYVYRVIELRPLWHLKGELVGLSKSSLRCARDAQGWYAAAKLAAVLRDDKGNLLDLPQSACQRMVEHCYRPQVLADIVEVIEPGRGLVPAGRVDYSLSPYEVLKPRYDALDHTFEGWSNRPTACLALYLMNCPMARALLRKSQTSKCRITAAKLRQLAQRNGWRLSIPQDAYFTDPFPPFYPYIEEVNYEEIARYLTEKIKEDSL